MDNRKWAANAAASPPAVPTSPSDGYPTDGNAVTGTPATQPGAYLFYALTEEIRNVILAAGLVPDIAVLTQLQQALDKQFKTTYMLVQDQRASGTQGGTPAAANQITQRVLNTVVNNNIVGASLSANVITLPAGIYHISGWAQVGNVGSAKSSIYNVSTNSIVIAGASQNLVDVSNAELLNFATLFDGVIEIAAITSFDLRTYTALKGNFASLPNSDFGYPVALAGQPDIYSQVSIFKIG